METTRREDVAIMAMGLDITLPGNEGMMWGSLESPGRLAMAVLAFRQFKAGIFVITGSHQKDGERGTQILRDRLFREWLPTIPEEDATEDLVSSLEKAMLLEPEGKEPAKNTEETMRNMGPELRERRVEIVILVSSPDHVCRAHLTALKVWSEVCSDWHPTILAVASRVPYTPGLSFKEAITKTLILEPSLVKKLGEDPFALVRALQDREGAIRIREALSRF